MPYVIFYLLVYSHIYCLILLQIYSVLWHFVTPYTERNLRESYTTLKLPADTSSCYVSNPVFKTDDDAVLRK